MENCESDVTDVKRKSHATNICSSLLQDQKCAPKSLIDTCPVVPTEFMGKYVPFFTTFYSNFQSMKPVNYLLLNVAETAW